MGKQDELTQREQVFVAAYAIERNGTKAAKAAGCPPKGAAVQASRWLKNPKILAAIESRQQGHLRAVQGELDISRERILKEYARVAFLDPRKLFRDDGTMKEPHELDDDTAAALASMETESIEAGDSEAILKRKAKFWNKLGSLDSLAKITGLMKEGTNVNVGVGLAIEISL